MWPCLSTNTSRSSFTVWGRWAGRRTPRRSAETSFTWSSSHSRAAVFVANPERDLRLPSASYQRACHRPFFFTTEPRCRLGNALHLHGLRRRWPVGQLRHRRRPSGCDCCRGTDRRHARSPTSSPLARRSLNLNATSPPFPLGPNGARKETPRRQAREGRRHDTRRHREGRRRQPTAGASDPRELKASTSGQSGSKPDCVRRRAVPCRRRYEAPSPPRSRG